METLYKEWISQVNVKCSVKRLENLLKYGDLLVISEDKLYVQSVPDNDTWFDYNNCDEENIRTPISKDVAVIVNPTPFLISYVKDEEKAISVINWDDKEIKTPYSSIKFLSKEFNLKNKDIYKDGIINMFAIPDVQSELPSIYYPRHHFPFRKIGDTVWYVNVLTLTYTSYDSNDSVFGVKYYNLKPRKFSKYYEEDDSEYDEDSDDKEDE